MSDLYIEQRGQGPRHIVLLHGWAMHGGVFTPLVDKLAKRATVHVVDLPGHGRSRDCTMSLEPSVCAKAIAEATPPAIWLGWSLGGLMALTGALEQPSKVQALAMVCSSPCFVRKPDWKYGMSPEVFATFGRELGQTYRLTLERFLALEAMGSSHARDDMRQLHEGVFARGEPAPRVLKEGLDILERVDLRVRLAELHCPGTWIAGARDRLIPWRAMQWAAARSGAAFTCVEHAGHAPFIGFADAVMNALEPLLGQVQELENEA